MQVYIFGVDLISFFAQLIEQILLNEYKSQLLFGEYNRYLLTQFGYSVLNNYKVTLVSLLNCMSCVVLINLWFLNWLFSWLCRQIPSVMSRMLLLLLLLSRVSRVRLCETP